MAEHVIIDCATGEATLAPVTDADLAAQQAAAAAQAQAAADEQTRRSAVVAQLQSLVGLQWGALSAAQKQTLIVALLYKVGALDKTLTVRPLGDWL